MKVKMNLEKLPLYKFHIISVFWAFLNSDYIFLSDDDSYLTLIIIIIVISLHLLDLSYRFATVLIYLNEPKQGGETAFPLAGNETFSMEVGLKIISISMRMWYNEKAEGSINLKTSITVFPFTY